MVGHHPLRWAGRSGHSSGYDSDLVLGVLGAPMPSAALVASHSCFQTPPQPTSLGPPPPGAELSLGPEGSQDRTPSPTGSSEGDRGETGQEGPNTTTGVPASPPRGLLLSPGDRGPG